MRSHGSTWTARGPKGGETGGVSEEQPPVIGVEWERAASQLLSGIRGSYSATADQMRADGADAHEFVIPQIAERLLPCPVTVRPGRDCIAVELRLSGEPFQLTIDDSARERNLLLPGEQNTLLVADPTTLTLTIYVQSLADLLDKGYLVRLNLESIFSGMALEEEDRLLAAREHENEEIGYRDLHVRPTSGEPDQRWQYFRKFVSDGPRPILQSDLLAYLPPTRTLVIVPDEIDSILQSARLLLSHGWEQWEFFSLAEQQSVIALESSGRRIANDWHRERSPIGNIRRILRSNPDLVTWLESARLVTRWEGRYARNLFELRNGLIHTPFAQTHLDTWATDIVIRAVSLINAMWKRFIALSTS